MNCFVPNRFRDSSLEKFVEINLFEVDRFIPLCIRI